MGLGGLHQFQGNFRLNHAAPPFDNPAVRRVLWKLADQDATLTAIGVPDRYKAKSCPSFWMCGTPLSTDAGSAGAKLDLAAARAATDVHAPERPGDGPYSEGATGSHRGHAGAYGTANHSDAMPPRPPPPAYDDVFSPMAPAAASSSAAPQRSELPVYRLVEHLNTGGVTRRREPQPTDSVKSADS